SALWTDHGKQSDVGPSESVVRSGKKLMAVGLHNQPVAVGSGILASGLGCYNKHGLKGLLGWVGMGLYKAEQPIGPDENWIGQNNLTQHC
ncbi:hypothetical protein Tco_0470462, partial [Tanacetum coccineum]